MFHLSKLANKSLADKLFHQIGAFHVRRDGFKPWSTLLAIFLKPTSKKHVCSYLPRHTHTCSKCSKKAAGLANKNGPKIFSPSREFWSSQELYKFQPIPTPAEGRDLNKLFPNCKQLVAAVLKPFIDNDSHYIPVISQKPHLNGRAWKTRIKLKWPQHITVTGDSESREQSEQNAYLLVCELFRNIGVLHRKSSTFCSGHTVLLEGLAELALINCVPNCFSIIHHHLIEGGKSRWHCELNIAWPQQFHVCATAKTLEGAQDIAYLTACVKLKGLRAFTSDNQFADILIKRHKIISQNNAIGILQHADYEIFVDASKVGFGAYLISNDAEDKVRWYTESWPAAVQEEFINLKCDSSFLEFYALVSAVFTWKHKYCGKSLLIWTDNSCCVHYIRHGFPNYQKSKISGFYKVFKVLSQTCNKYQIEIDCRHICRHKNIAADMLSRSKVNEFKEIVPNTNTEPKKSKKLLFILPLKTKDSDETKSTHSS